MEDVPITAQEGFELETKGAQQVAPEWEMDNFIYSHVAPQTCDVGQGRVGVSRTGASRLPLLHFPLSRLLATSTPIMFNLELLEPLYVFLCP